jgi:aminoglycoside 6'-N-acetyltransferase
MIMMNEISFIPLDVNHLHLLHRWMHHPHVSEWWSEGKVWSQEDIQAKYASYTQGYKVQNGVRKLIHPYIIQVKGMPIGYIQYYNAFDFPRECYQIEELWNHSSHSLAALDFYIGESDYLGKGLGIKALKNFLTHHVFSHYAACLVDPDKNNKTALSTYTKAGFSTHLDLGTTILMVALKEEQRNPLIILGSSRSNGETLQAINAVIRDQQVSFVDLKKLNISYYDYHHANEKDDFIPLAELMVKHNPIILATPVYWYTMSAIMKTFIDRWSDLIGLRKDLGRRLAGKELYLITSFAGDFPKGFEDPIAQTCQYLDMHYGGCFYFYSGENQALKKQNIPHADSFASKIWHPAKMID